MDKPLYKSAFWTFSVFILIFCFIRMIQSDCSGIGGKMCESDADCRVDDCNQYACHPKHEKNRTCRLHCAGVLGAICHDGYPCCMGLGMECKAGLFGPMVCVVQVNSNSSIAPTTTSAPTSTAPQPSEFVN